MKTMTKFMFSALCAAAMVTSVQTDPCRHLLRTHHAVVPRLHGNTACLVRMDGEDTLPAGRAGTEHRCSTVSCSADLGIRTHLLLRHLPVGSIPGHCFLALRQTEEKPFPLLVRTEMATLRCAGSIRTCHYRRKFLLLKEKNRIL